MDAPTQPPAQRSRGGRLIAAGGAVALLAGLGIAAALVLNGGGEKAQPSPASQAGLVIESGPEDGRIDPAKPLRCFVDGQFVGDLTLTECARRNGVATDALDVGVDESGALAAADQAGTAITPLPPKEAAPPAEEQPAAAEPAAPAATPAPAAAQAACWRHNRGQWRRLADMDLNACVQTLFGSRCERAGAADYGRWGQQTLRLVTGKVEVSNDNQSFRTLANQGPGCSIPPVG
jgi:hypothetical protein